MFLKTITLKLLREYKFSTDLQFKDLKYSVHISLKLLNKHLVRVEKRNPNWQDIESIINRISIFDFYFRIYVMKIQKTLGYRTKNRNILLCMMYNLYYKNIFSFSIIRSVVIFIGKEMRFTRF